MRYSIAALGCLALSSAQDPETAVIKPGVPWFDTDGNRIYAGGANLVQDGGKYWMIGEGKKVYQDISQCFNLYSSQDLSTWKFEGCALNNSAIVAPPEYPPTNGYYRMERPKIIGRNPVSKKYVMWFHCDQLNFGMKSVGVLTADAITGPYSFASPCFKPDGQDSYDMGTYWDDAAAGGDGHAYLIRSVRNAFAGISQLTPDWTNTTAAGIVSQGPDMEGQALMRDAATGTLYAAGSHLTGWAANPAQFVVSPNASLVGAQWGDNYNPSGDSTTWNSQSTFIFPFKHADGHVTYIWMADRWNANGPGGLDNMTAIWLPLVPPTGPAPAAPAPGWVLSLDTCNAADTKQGFEIAVGGDGSVTHVSSGLCVAQPSGAPGTALVLAKCDASDPAQMWHSPTGQTLTSTARPGDAGCVSWNEDNQQITAGNPVIAYACGQPPAWNEMFALPLTGSTGVIAALGSDGSTAGTCVSVAPPSNPSQWTLPWFDAWSLKDF